MVRLHRTKRQLSNEIFREPNEEELLQALIKGGMGIRKAQNALRNANIYTISTEQKINEEGEPISMKFADPNTPSENEIIENWHSGEKMRSLTTALDKLTERNRAILELYFDGIPVKDIAAQFNLSRKSIDYIRATSIETLRKAMRKYLD